MNEHRGNFFRDERLDKAASWALAGAVTVALTVGAWFFRSLTTELRSLHQAVSGLSTKVAVLEERDKLFAKDILRRLDRLERMVDDLENKQPR